ncbi:nucleotidyl transferase AbiEii/AbiGii toxin family protein [Candidatus Micrarchaeota archaeon]|nr:nucleotidyl transferase AbiEii/AbiGii toxin family protein [Candidatus Micrarchaeota archaeon]
MYAKEVTEASKSALLELGLSLKRYHDDMVLTGGWAPYFITKGYFSHCGSIDIDLVLKTKIMPKYDTIRKSIIGLGYTAENPFRYSRIVRSPVDGKEYEIHLDFLCEKEGTKYVNFQNVQDSLQAFVFDGLSLTFDFNFEQEISTVLPDNGEARTNFKVVDLAGSMVLKGQALDGRAKPKDSYDIFALTHYLGGPRPAADYFNRKYAGIKMTSANEKILKHSLRVIRDKFKNASQMGPFQVAAFTENKYSREAVANQVNEFLDALIVKGLA